MVHAYADSDWAGNKKEGTSTSGGVLQWGGSVVKAWASSQRTVALSSGEAELYAATKAASQFIGMLSMAEDFGVKLEGQVLIDSSAALGIISREGLGRTRHIRVQYLWAQSLVQQGKIRIKKVHSSEMLQT